MLQATESSGIQLACAACPVSAALKDRSGLPWGCVVRPFASPRDGSRLPVVAEKDVERCANCFAYPNHLCAFEYRRCLLRPPFLLPPPSSARH